MGWLPLGCLNQDLSINRMNAISNPVNLQILQILILTNWVDCPWLSEPGFTGLQDEQDECKYGHGICCGLTFGTDSYPPFGETSHEGQMP